MDESQKRKKDAKEFVQDFLESNKKIGVIVSTIFISLCIIFLAFFYFYSNSDKGQDTSNQENIGNLNTGGQQNILERLFPTFTEGQDSQKFDENGLPIFTNSSSTLDGVNIGNTSGVAGEDNSKVVQLEKDPTLAFVVFPKPVSVKNYIKNKPKLCGEKVEVVLKKDEKSLAVKNFQNVLRSVEGFESVSDSEILDEGTREQLYILQKRYAEIIYKKRKDKEPSRVIDKETAHFINLLCNFDKENPEDFINIPTLRYAKKINREIVEYNILSKEKNVLESKLATNTVEAIFSPNGEYIVFRSEKQGEIISEFSNLKTKNRLNLEKNISSLHFNNKNLLVYGVPNNNSFIVKVYDPFENVVKRVAEIPLSQWSLFWQSDTEIGIYNKPSALAMGIFMILDIKTGTLNQITNTLNGLSVTPSNVPDFSIVSTSAGNNLKTLLLNVKTKKLGDLQISTMAEKCAKEIILEGVFCAIPKSINNNFVYPDDWYKGKILTEDIIVYKTLSGTSTRIISNLENKSMSLINLKVDKDGIFFIDENTLSLYSIEVK